MQAQLKRISTDKTVFIFISPSLSLRKQNKTMGIVQGNDDETHAQVQTKLGFQVVDPEVHRCAYQKKHPDSSGGAEMHISRGKGLKLRAQSKTPTGLAQAACIGPALSLKCKNARNGPGGWWSSPGWGWSLELHRGLKSE